MCVCVCVCKIPAVNTAEIIDHKLTFDEENHFFRLCIHVNRGENVRINLKVVILKASVICITKRLNYTTDLVLYSLSKLGGFTVAAGVCILQLQRSNDVQFKLCLL